MILCMMKALLQVFCPFKGCPTDCALMEILNGLKGTEGLWKGPHFQWVLKRGQGVRERRKILAKKRNDYIAYTRYVSVCTNNWASSQQYFCVQPCVKLWHPVALGSLGGSLTGRGGGEGSSSCFISGSQCPLAVLKADYTQLLISSSASLAINNLVPLQLPLLFLLAARCAKDVTCLSDQKYCASRLFGEWTFRESLLWIQNFLYLCQSLWPFLSPSMTMIPQKARSSRPKANSMPCFAPPPIRARSLIALIQ